MRRIRNWIREPGRVGDSGITAGKVVIFDLRGAGVAAWDYVRC